MSVDDDVASALRAIGIEAARAERISGLDLAIGDRATFRVLSTEGRAFKVRRATRVENAERLSRLVAVLGDVRVPRVLHREGRLTVESWIEGVPLSRLPLDGARIRRAADLLARIFRVASVDGVPLPQTRGVAGLLTETDRKIAAIAARGLVSAKAAAELSSRARATAPERAALGLVHEDLTAENLVEDAAGDLWAVDGGGLRLGFFDFALARTRIRWPMPDGHFADLLARHRGVWPDAFADAQAPFWLVAAAVRSAYYRASRGAPCAEVALDRLASVRPEFPIR